MLERRRSSARSRPVALSPTASYPAFQRFVREEMLAKAGSDLKAREADLAKTEKDLSTAKDPAALDKARHAVELGRARPLPRRRRALVAIEASIAADLARYSQPRHGDGGTLARTAAKARAQLAEKHGPRNRCSARAGAR